MNERLGIIGRERALVDGLAKILRGAAGRHHNYAPLIDTRYGARFDVEILVDGDEPSGHVARVTVEILPLEHSEDLTVPSAPST